LLFYTTKSNKLKHVKIVQQPELKLVMTG